jgi:hypothetical protein
MPRSSPAPPTSTRAVRKGGEEETVPRTPLSSSQLAARRRLPCPRQCRPTAHHSRDRSPPACEQGRRAQCHSTHAPRTPKPTSFWTPSPSSLRPINTPSNQTNRLAPSPATSQTCSFRPACSSPTTPAPSTRYWTWRAPTRSTLREQAATGNRRRSHAGVVSTPRRQVLLPLRSPPSPSSSSLLAGELRPS